MIVPFDSSNIHIKIILITSLKISIIYFKRHMFRTREKPATGQISFCVQSHQMFHSVSFYSIPNFSGNDITVPKMPWIIFVFFF